jgi:lipoprotein Spr
MKQILFFISILFIALTTLANNGFSVPYLETPNDTSLVKANKVNLIEDEIEEATTLQFKYAIILGVNVESLKNNELLRFIENWYGVKYLYGGTTMKGIDCSAFTQVLLKNVYGIATDRVVGDQYNKCNKINRAELQIGDLLFFKHKDKSYLTHVAFYLGNNKFIHASVNKGITIDDLNSKYYSNIYYGAGRPKISLTPTISKIEKK